ncbi:outer membrane protein assembly factor BamC [Escherichia coli]|uniref:outer membrane protein assembly factor BamC n=1 Tax=Escherichia coli TaxID=562 RepID=UPI003D9A5E35
MAYSVQKSRLAKVAGVSLVLLLAACSSDSRYKRQVSGDEAYLEAAPLAELHAPAGMILPVTSGDYAIPVTNGSGAVGHFHAHFFQRSWQTLPNHIERPAYDQHW